MNTENLTDDERDILKRIVISYIKTERYSPTNLLRPFTLLGAYKEHYPFVVRGIMVAPTTLKPNVHPAKRCWFRLTEDGEEFINELANMEKL